MSDWFIVNVADARATSHERGGSFVTFESPDDRFPELGINIRVLGPGQPSAVYHEESAQEDFLVLYGECLAIIDGQQRRLDAWDFVHCPAGTPHVFVGAGDRPCAVLMVGSRRADKKITYWSNELAARYGASAARPTSVPAEAYADWGWNFTPTDLSWPPS